MSTFLNTVNSLWKVLLIALAFGAALPAIFAYGVRFLSLETLVDGQVRRRTSGSIVAGLICMAVVALTVLAGILFIMKDFLAQRFGIHLP